MGFFHGSFFKKFISFTFLVWNHLKNILFENMTLRNIQFYQNNCLKCKSFGYNSFPKFCDFWLIFAKTNTWQMFLSRLRKIKSEKKHFFEIHLWKVYLALNIWIEICNSEKNFKCCISSKTFVWLDLVIESFWIAKKCQQSMNHVYLRQKIPAIFQEISFWNISSLF